MAYICGSCNIKAMLINERKYYELRSLLDAQKVVLVAVSKTKSMEAIKDLYNLGHRDFAENYVQELVDKQAQLPADIHWHFIGHLQTNKVKYIASFVHLIHGVDSFKLLKEINKQAGKANRVIDVLLQIHIAQEETKFGFEKSELEVLFNDQKDALEELTNVRIVGFMGMASFTDDQEKIRTEFKRLYSLYSILNLKRTTLNVLSMGMSGDYSIALEEGSNMVRIGSLIFGGR